MPLPAAGADMQTVIPEGTPGLPLGVSVTLQSDSSTIWVTINARLHLRKHFELPHCYCAKHYNAQSILQDGDFLKYLARFR